MSAHDRLDKFLKVDHTEKHVVISDGGVRQEGRLLHCQIVMVGASFTLLTGRLGNRDETDGGLSYLSGGRDWTRGPPPR